MYNVQNKCLQSYYNLFIAGGFKLLDINKFTEKLFLLTNSMLFTPIYYTKGLSNNFLYFFISGV